MTTEQHTALVDLLTEANARLDVCGIVLQAILGVLLAFVLIYAFRGVL